MSSSYVSADLRRRVAAQARHRCGYCLTAEAIVGIPMDFEHIVPESEGGATEEENLWLACSLCNSYKGSRTSFRDPISGRDVPLFNPRRQRWSEHFAWEESGSMIVGLTATGRATVVALVLNRPPLVKARKRWAAVGWHPPRDAGTQ